MSGQKSISQFHLSHNRKNIVRRIEISGSKSESNRLLILKHLYFPQMSIKGLSDSEDTKTMLRCLSDRGNFIHAGEAGTVMRFLTAYLAIRDGEENVLMGTPGMHKRPIGSLVNALCELGTEIRYLEKEGYPPIKIFGTKIKGGSVQVDAGTSSQFITSLMMIAPLMELGLRIQLRGTFVSAPYVHLTANMMERLGFKIVVSDEEISIDPGIPKHIPIWKVEPDWSSASYWFLIATLAKGSEIYLPGFKPNSNQGDAAVVKYFEILGVKHKFDQTGIKLYHVGGHPESLSLNLIDHPDLTPALATACAALNINTELYGLQSLRIKETDRLSALQNELSKTGAEIEIGSDYLKVISGIKEVQSRTFKTYDDHRMAMALAPLALLDEIVIEDPQVVDKSYPNFWSDLEKVGFQLSI